MDNYIYEEKQRSTMVVIIVFLVAAIILISVALSQWFDGQTQAMGEQIILPIVAVVFIALFIAFFRLHIVLTTDQLQFGFGPFKKTVKKGEIRTAEIKKFEFKNYWGYGIRFGRFDKSWGYIAGSDKGIYLTLEHKKYFFTTDNPEQLLDLIKSYLI